MSCIHATVCRHKSVLNIKGIGDKIIIAPEASCELREICKYYLGSPVLRESDEKPEKKQGKKKAKKSTDSPAPKLERHFTTSDQDIQYIRNIMRGWRGKGRFSENQIAAIDVIGSTLTRNLTDINREQLLSIYKDVKRGEKKEDK